MEDKHNLKTIGQDVMNKFFCETSYMNPNKKIKYNDWYKKTDSTIWIDADFEVINLSVDDPH